VRTLPDRDLAKSVAVVEETYLWLNELQFARNDLIVAVGGGALTDVAGFIAATYLRGVPVVYMPTTLLGAIDASIGGKTAINIGGKNLAGVFRHPNRVLIDLEVLAGLPVELLREGAAEAIKAGLIADPVLFELFESHGLDAPLEEVVRRAVTVKADVVREDFREQGRRGILNYGHTIGHAIEMEAGMSHGHAVAIGMVAAGAVSARVAGFGHERRQNDAIAGLGLPTASPTVDAARIRSLVALDKKRDRGGLRMTVISDIGTASVVSVDDATVDAALQVVGIG
jgi:3-dehydroquinate synthetase